MELKLSDRHRAEYSKLYASSSDVGFARQCASHIRKKGWFRSPWSRGTIYFQQSAYVTALIVSYARPFSIGRSGLHFPKRLIPYNEGQMELHRNFLDRRNKVYAHSDSDKWDIRPWRSADFETTIVGQPWLIVGKEEIDLFLEMTTGLLAAIANREKQILSAY